VNGSLNGLGKSSAIRNVDYAKFLWCYAAPDHVFPRSLGGLTDMDNLVTSCSRCNYSKMDLTLEQMDVRSPG
jgi:5-methylcytosine-specific restriction endonuclease McrA